MDTVKQSNKLNDTWNTYVHLHDNNDWSYLNLYKIV